MSAEYKEGQLVWLRIGKRPAMSIRIIEKLKEDRYRLDWGSCGFNKLLNTVAIPAKSFSANQQ